MLRAEGAWDEIVWPCEEETFTPEECCKLKRLCGDAADVQASLSASLWPLARLVRGRMTILELVTERRGTSRHELSA